MKLEPLTKNVRVQVSERTRGEEYIALGGIAAAICIVAFLGQVTQRSLFLAGEVVLAVFAVMAYRNGRILRDLHLPHRAKRSFVISVVLAILTVAVLVAQELVIRAIGGV